MPTIIRLMPNIHKRCCIVSSPYCQISLKPRIDRRDTLTQHRSSRKTNGRSL